MKQLFCFLILLFCMSFSYEALAQEERATPKSGEGISGFLQRNGRTGKAYYQEFLELNKKQLRGKEELRLGVKYLLPPLKKGSGNTAASSNSSASNSSASNSSARSGNKTIREPLSGQDGERHHKHIHPHAAPRFLSCQWHRDRDHHARSPRRNTHLEDGFPSL